MAFYASCFRYLSSIEKKKHTFHGYDDWPSSIKPKRRLSLTRFPMEIDTKMEQEKRVVDLSSFFLVEAIGDSEGDLFDPNMEDPFLDGGGSSGGHPRQGNHGVADDDAESCSHDVCRVNVHGVNDLVVINGWRVHGDEDDDEEEEEEDNGVDKMCMDGKNMGRGDHHNQDRASEVKSTAGSHSWRNCVDSRKDKMSEKEKNRLFWETCLAS